MGLLDGMTKKIQGSVNKISPKSKIKEEDILNVLTPNEELVDTITQVVPALPKTIVLTNDRIIIMEQGLASLSMKDYYFRDMKDVSYNARFSGGVITFSTDKGNNIGKREIDKLPLDESKVFYSKLQGIEKEWWQKRRDLELEEKRIASGAHQIVVNTAPAPTPTPVTKDNDFEVKLQKLKSMFDKGLISQEEYSKKKEQLLDSL